MNIFISDVHMGSRFSKTKELLEFLKWAKTQNPKKLYIVGDFIDGWKLKRNWHWTEDCNLVIRKILSMVKNGTEVYYLAGNHDDFLRLFINDFSDNFDNIKILDEVVHVTSSGEKLLVIHGDKFDLTLRVAMRYTKWLCILGDIGYEFLIRLNSIVNHFRKFLGLDYWSLSQYVKSKVKSAGNYIGGFEELMIQYVKDHGYDGVICGHIHHANIRDIDGIRYYNCGDWVESKTALIEDDKEIRLFSNDEAL